VHTRINADHFEHQALCPSVAIPERVNDVELAVVVRKTGDKFVSRQPNKKIFLRKLPKELIPFRFDTANVREPCAALADVDRPKFTGPVTQNPDSNIARPGPFHTYLSCLVFSAGTAGPAATLPALAGR